MADTLIVPFSEELKKKYREVLNEKADALANGGCQSFEEYKYHCGVIWGVALAESMLIELTKQATEGDD